MKDQDHCKDNPCNNGECFDWNTFFTCVCKQGYTGQFCVTGIVYTY